MTLNLKKIEEISKPRSVEAVEKSDLRKKNRDWLRVSQEIALILHNYLRNEKLTQKEFAEKLGVSAVYVNKLLKGSENLTIETIFKIQRIIGQQIISIHKPYLSEEQLDSAKIEGVAEVMR